MTKKLGDKGFQDMDIGEIQELTNTRGSSRRQLDRDESFLTSVRQ